MITTDKYNRLDIYINYESEEHFEVPEAGDGQ
jgi:hypothetical protein